MGTRLDLSLEDERIVIEHFLALRRFAAVVCPDLDPEDLVQEAILRSLNRGQLSQLDNPRAYLRRSVLNLAANERRSLSRRRRALARMSADETPDVYPSDLDDLLRLSPEARAVLFLTVVDGCTYAEAAVVLGFRESTARVRASRALKKLRVIVAKEAGE